MVAQSPSVPSPAPAPVPMASLAAQQHFSTDTAQQHDVMGCSIAVQHGARPVPPSFIGILPCGLPSEDCAQCLSHYLFAHTTTRGMPSYMPIRLLHAECPAMMLAQRCDARGSCPATRDALFVPLATRRVDAFSPDTHDMTRSPDTPDMTRCATM